MLFESIRVRIGAHEDVTDIDDDVDITSYPLYITSAHMILIFNPYLVCVMCAMTFKLRTKKYGAGKVLEFYEKLQLQVTYTGPAKFQVFGPFNDAWV